MAKASLTLLNGAVVQIEGTAEEVRNLLQFYGETGGRPAPAERKPSVRPNDRKVKSEPTSSKGAEVRTDDSTRDLSQIVNLAKDCDEADAIECQILDRTSQVDRTLLPLYIVHEYLTQSRILQ
jgi:hypothetical protein